MVLAIAACGGLRSAHDCRPRRALLHHSHSWAPPIRRRRFRVTRPGPEVHLFNLITILSGAAVACPELIRAQSITRIRRVGVLWRLTTDKPLWQSRFEVFTQ